MRLEISPILEENEDEGEDSPSVMNRPDIVPSIPGSSESSSGAGDLPYPPGEAHIQCVDCHCRITFIHSKGRYSLFMFI